MSIFQQLKHLKAIALHIPNQLWLVLSAQLTFLACSALVLININWNASIIIPISIAAELILKFFFTQVAEKIIHKK